MKRIVSIGLTGVLILMALAATENKPTPAPPIGLKPAITIPAVVKPVAPVVPPVVEPAPLVNTTLVPRPSVCECKPCTCKPCDCTALAPKPAPKPSAKPVATARKAAAGRWELRTFYYSYGRFGRRQGSEQRWVWIPAPSASRAPVKQAPAYYCPPGGGS